jgi:RNAse (barnase) inhibitor barstar
MKDMELLSQERESAMDTPVTPVTEMPLKNVRSNIVQSIRAFRVGDLQAAATTLGHHFLYTNLAKCLGKQDVLDTIAEQFRFPIQMGKNFDALYDCITDPLHKSGPQPGFIVVLEHIPVHSKFDKDVREQLLDIFRDAAEYWSDRKVPFRCFYSFSVARTAKGGKEKFSNDMVEADALLSPEGEKMPTDKIVDVTPMALRMSSPFNAGYWMSAAN